MGRTMLRAATVLVAMLVGCVTPRPPVPPHPPAADRFERAASQDPTARASAAAELTFDPSPHAVQMLLVLLERDVDPSVRARAADAIAERRDGSLDGVLARAAVSDPDPATRVRARRAYDRLWPWRKRPGTAAALSLLCPGCGQLYLRETLEGTAQLAAFGGLLGGSIALLSGETISLDGNATSTDAPIGLLLGVAAQNLWFYSIFDAYRDARVLRGDTGYSHTITRESLADLAIAPFNPHVLKSPWVWAGVPAMLAAGLGISYALGDDGLSDRPTIFDVDRVNVLGRRFHRGPGFLAGSAYFVGMFAPVGLGEEALFRGLIQTELEERWGPVRGLIASSAIFGAVHVFNFLQDDPATALVAVPLISVLGATMGYAYQRTDYTLSTSVAMHFWYDTLLSMAAFALDPEHQPFVVNFARPW